MPRARPVPGTFLFAIAMVSLMASPARAALTVCNQTLDIANVALAVGASDEGLGDGTDEVSDKGGSRSEGWWVVAPNRCAEIVPDDLGDATYHLLAIDVRGQLLVTGGAPFCTAPRSFRIDGRSNCWLRGHTKGNFMPVETRGARDWTVFLREDE